MPNPTPIPGSDQVLHPTAMTQSAHILNMTNYLSHYNAELNLNLSLNEVQDYASALESRYLSYSTKTTSGIFVENYSEFQLEVSDLLNLSPDIRNEYLKEGNNFSVPYYNPNKIHTQRSFASFTA